MGVSILSYELSQYFNVKSGSTQIESPTLLRVQKILYYLTQILSFLVNPILNEFKKLTEQEEEQYHSQSDQSLELDVESNRCSCCSIFTKALCNQLKYYVTLLVVAVIALIFVAIFYKIDITLFKSYLDILPSITNIYGLFLFSATIGTGLSMIPSSIYHCMNPVNQMRKNLMILSEPYVKNRPNYRYLIDQCKNDYRVLKKLHIDHDKKQIYRKRCYLVLFIFSVILSFVYFLQEISYTLNHSGFEYLLNIVNNKLLNQIIIFVFIAWVTAIGGHILSCLKLNSLVSCCNKSCCCCNNNECDCESCLLKTFGILNYRFDPKGTESSTFGFWSTYLQRLVPTIAYHCQQMAGANQSSLEQIMGKLDEFNVYTTVVKYTLPIMLALGWIFGLCFSVPVFDREKNKKGMKVFKRMCLGINDLNIEAIDMLIVDDIEINEIDISEYRKANKDSNAQLDEPLNMNDFHKPSVENNNDV